MTLLPRVLPALIFTLAFGPAAFAEPDAPPDAIHQAAAKPVRGEFTRAATPEEVRQAFAGFDPATLPRGRVVLSCRVKQDGTFTRCQIVSSGPAGQRRDSVVALEGKKAGEIAQSTVSARPDDVESQSRPAE